MVDKPKHLLINAFKHTAACHTRLIFIFTKRRNIFVSTKHWPFVIQNMNGMDMFFLYHVGGWIDIALISPLSLSPFYCSTKIGLNASYAYKIWFSFHSQMAIGKIEDWVSEQSISFDRTKQISFFLSLWNKIYKCLSFFRPKEVEKGVISVVSSTSTENDWMLEVWMAVTVKKRL